MHAFMPAEILLPKIESMEKWAVIACDQFVSQPEYWANVRSFVADAPSALHMILPEADLELGDTDTKIANINRTMADYLENGLFTKYDQAFVYVERTLQNGTVRKGVVGMVDLTQYDYTPGSGSAVRATEKTVTERIPPRQHIRELAPLELPHVLLLCDDPEGALVEWVTAQKETLPLLYDFDLMAEGGHITGRLIAGETAQILSQRIAAYEAARKDTPGGVVYAVGDGNHSLAAAKACYNPENPNSRYALVELENIHDEAQVFEPIHRIVKGVDPQALLTALEEDCCEGGCPVTWHAGEASGTVYLNTEGGRLPVGVLQAFLDKYMAGRETQIDYIHGDEDLRQLAGMPENIGFLLPAMEKSGLFPGIVADGVLPRKTFSMGHAREKRYYLEAREIRVPRRRPLTTAENQQAAVGVMAKLHEICQELNLRYFLAFGTLIGAVRHKGYIPWDDDLDIMMPRPDYDRLVAYFKEHAAQLEPYRLFTPDTVEDYPYMIGRVCDCRYEIDTDNEKNCGMGAFVDIYPMDGIGKTKAEAVKLMKRTGPFCSLCFLSTRLRCVRGLTTSKLKLLIKLPAFVFAKLVGKRRFMKKLSDTAAKCDYENSSFIGCVVWEGSGEDAVFPKEWFAETLELPFENHRFFVPAAYDKILRKSYGDYMKLPPEEDRIAHHFYRIYRK